MQALIAVVLALEGIAPSTKVDNCEVVRAVLDARLGDARDKLLAPGMEQRCSLVNGYRDGIVLVDAVLGEKSKEKVRWKPFLEPGQACGHDVLSTPPSRIPAEPERVVFLVGIELVREGDGAYSFDEHVKTLSSTDPYQKKGVIGTSCLPAAKGYVRKVGKKWVGQVTNAHPAKEAPPDQRAEQLESYRTMGIAPRRWPPLQEDTSVRLIAGTLERRGRTEILATVLNLTGGRVYVPRRMALNNPLAPEATRDVWYEVLDQNGNAQPFKCSTEVTPLVGREFEKLEDGEGFSGVLLFDLCYGLLKDKWYEIRVHLKYTPLNQSGLQPNAFLTEVIAAPIKFQYRGPDPIDVYMKRLSSPDKLPATTSAPPQK